MAEELVKPKPLEPQLLALQGQLASFRLSDQQIRAIAAYTHPRSKSRGKAKPSALLAGYSESFAHGDSPKWFRKPEIVKAINIAVTYWAETLEASTSMDVINDEMFHIATFDLGSLYHRDREGVLRMKDLTKVDTRALSKIKLKRVTKTDPETKLHTTTEEVELEVYNKIHGARLFAHVKGALRDNRVGNVETPHRLILMRGSGKAGYTADREKPLEVPGEILDVAPNSPEAIPAEGAPAPEGGTAGNDREEV